MSLLRWNCRGLGSRRAVSNFIKLVRLESPFLIFLSETKLRASEFDFMNKRTEFVYKCVSDCPLESRRGFLLYSGVMVSRSRSFSKMSIVLMPLSPSPRLPPPRGASRVFMDGQLPPISPRLGSCFAASMNLMISCGYALAISMRSFGVMRKWGVFPRWPGIWKLSVILWITATSLI